MNGNAQHTDVLICGCGSAGITAALWLARYGVSFRMLERRNGPLKRGQADGVQCRTVEIFESFGLAEQLLKEAYHVLELAFWSPDQDNGGIRWSHYAADTEPGLSHMPHVILNQARINEMLTEEMLKCGGPEVDYGFEVKSVEVDAAKADDTDAYPVTVTAEKDGVVQVFHAKYAIVSSIIPCNGVTFPSYLILVQGCDGAHSAVRKALGFKMLGDSTDAVWGVMDLYPRTDFPDVRKKAIIQSAFGNLIIIPREGDSLVRFYIELPSDTVASQVTLEDLHERARLIFQPYTMEIAETSWWSAYAIGQRLADHFHQDYRVFLTGDACHTHSPKAGQGMNVSLQDGHNIGWKLGAFLSGQASEALLETYVSERQQTAAELIEFDRNWTKLFKSSKNGEPIKVSADHIKDQYIQAGRYTAGQAYRYNKSIIVSPEDTSGDASGAGDKKMVVGMRFPSAQVVRYSDARALQLLSVIKADGRWRVVVFAGDIQRDEARDALDKVCPSMTTRSCTHTDELHKSQAATTIQEIVAELIAAKDGPDSIIESLLVLKTKRTELKAQSIPEVFRPTIAPYGVTCKYTYL